MYNAKVILDSVSPMGIRLLTLEVTLPRIVLAEFNTHRVFSRNSASSRAIPVEKMLRKVDEDPFLPVTWGKNQKGMQAEQELTPEQQEEAKKEWLGHRDDSVRRAKNLLNIGVHKQLTNRLLESHLWHTIIVTATEFDNWEALRRDKNAQPEIQKAANMMYEVTQQSVPQKLYGEWHLPLVTNVDFDDLVDAWHKGNLGEEPLWQTLKKISSGRCARVSYLTHDGKRDPFADIQLCTDLQKNGHMSPLEHVARPMTDKEILLNRRQVFHVRSPGSDFIEIFSTHLRQDELESIGCQIVHAEKETFFLGNFNGWVQMRKELPYESVFQKK